MKLQVNFRFSNSGPITMIYLRGLRTVLRLALEVSVLVSVLWQGQGTNSQDQGQGQGTSPQDQDQGQGTEVQDQDQDQGSKNLPRGSLEPRHCLEAPHHWQDVCLVVQINTATNKLLIVSWYKPVEFN